MSEQVAKFNLKGIDFTIETVEGFGGTVAQFKIDAESNGNKKTVEIFDVRKVGDNQHISPNIKKVTRVSLKETEKQESVDVEDSSSDIDLEDITN